VPPDFRIQIRELLERAAALCVEHGGDRDVFMHAAWSAFLDAKPGMREQFEDEMLRARLDELRGLGRVPQA
jgi:hypothetical protein